MIVIFPRFILGWIRSQGKLSAPQITLLHLVAALFPSSSRYLREWQVTAICQRVHAVQRPKRVSRFTPRLRSPETSTSPSKKLTNIKHFKRYLHFTYELLYRHGIEHGNANALSRLPLMDIPEITTVTRDSCGLWNIHQRTARDPVLSQVLQFVLQRRPVAIQE